MAAIAQLADGYWGTISSMMDEIKKPDACKERYEKLMRWKIYFKMQAKKAKT